MTTPLKSVLVTDWSRKHIAGHDLDGGGMVSFTLDTTIVGTQALGRDVTQWSVGDIATLKLDPQTQLAQLRIVTPKQHILRVREFQIVDIVDNIAKPEARARHIFLKGWAENGAVYVMPMLGYTAWESAWDLTNLQTALQKAQTPKADAPRDPATQLSYEITIDEIAPGDKLKSCIDHYNTIFYPGSKDAGTVFDKVASLTVTTTTVKQGGPTRAHMYTAAFLKKTKGSSVPGTDEYMREKMGTAFSQPYFVVDGERVFIRTSPTPKT